MFSLYNMVHLKEYDGKGYTLYGFSVSKDGDDNSGLFAQNSNDLTIKNLSINTLTSISPNISGVLIGHSSHTVNLENINLTGDIKVSARMAGGLIGKSDGPVTMTGININGTTTITGSQDAGGIIGYASAGSTILNTNINGILNVSGNAVAGGILGDSAVDTTIKNAYLYCNLINVSSVNRTGGIIGRVVDGNVSLNDVGIFAASGLVSNTDNNAGDGAVGGFIGESTANSVDIQNSFSSIYVNGSGKGVGGFIGEISCSDESNIIGCYSSGYTYNGGYIDTTEPTVPGHYTVIGRCCLGIGGFIGEASGNLSITRCFSANSVTSDYVPEYQASDYMGGFIGVIGDNVKLSDCYTVSQVKTGLLGDSLHGAFAGKCSQSATISNAYYLGRYTNSMVDDNDIYDDDDLIRSIAENPNNQIVTKERMYDLSYILADEGTLTIEENTQHHDILHPILYYPYKNWTDVNAYLGPGTTPKLVFFGDW